MHTYTPSNNVFYGPITNLLSILCMLIEILSRTHAKQGKSLNGFKFGTFTGRFQSDSAASKAVKGLWAKGMHLVFITPSSCSE